MKIENNEIEKLLRLLDHTCNAACRNHYYASQLAAQLAVRLAAQTALLETWNMNGQNTRDFTNCRTLKLSVSLNKRTLTTVSLHPSQDNGFSSHYLLTRIQIRHELQLMRRPSPCPPQARHPSPPSSRSSQRGASSSPTRCRTKRPASRMSAST